MLPVVLEVNIFLIKNVKFEKMMLWFLSIFTAGDRQAKTKTKNSTWRKNIQTT